MLKLPTLSSDDMVDSFQNVRAKFKPIGTQWIFEDVMLMMMKNNMNMNMNIKKKQNKNMIIKKKKRKRKRREKRRKRKRRKRKIVKNFCIIKSIFDHFDKNNDGKLENSDINDLYKHHNIN